jgi:hypothetical protein
MRERSRETEKEKNEQRKDDYMNGEREAGRKAKKKLNIRRRRSLLMIMKL